MKKGLCFIAVMLLSAMFLVGGAYALPISAITDVTGAIEAKDGIANDPNNDLSDLNNGSYWYTDWVDLQKVDWESTGQQLTTNVDIGLTVTPSGQANTGTYAFNANVWDTFSDIMIVLKDGGMTDPNDSSATDKYYWFAYLLDDGISSGNWDYPGDKDISHLSVYGRGAPVPEPSTLILLGLGILGLVGVRFVKKS